MDISSLILKQKIMTLKQAKQYVKDHNTEMQVGKAADSYGVVRLFARTVSEYPLPPDYDEGSNGEAGEEMEAINVILAAIKN